MRTTIQILTVCALTVGMAVAQENTSSVQSIMTELSRHQGTSPSAVASAAKPAETVMSPVAAPPAVNPAAAVDVPAALEAGREQYVAGNYTEAEAGFKAVLGADPGNKSAAEYLSWIARDAHGSAEEAAMQRVDQDWGMILRYYSVADKFVKNMQLDGAGGSEEFKQQLKKASVEFPRGSSVRYLPELQKLFVENTPANLEKLEEVLSAFNRAEVKASAEQVKIETRFVEFNEGALAELGFNWSDVADGKAVKIGDQWSAADGQELFSGALRTMPFDQTGALGQGEVRATGSGSANRIEDMFNSQAAGAGTLGVSGNVAGTPIELLIRALDQTAGVDVLSAPSVTTLSGQPAVITVGERHFYPETYEAGESQGAVLHVKYSDFTEKILGVEMTVTPTIKGDEIQMKINPKINELLGWQKFKLAEKDTSYTYYQYRVGMQFEHEAVVARLPLFNRREVKTEVTVASGATVGMGGLIGEKTEAFSDRVPVLGSIPLVGRLFRSEGSRTVKRNLMIFVTASKVAPSGRIISERSFIE